MQKTKSKYVFPKAFECLCENVESNNIALEIDHIYLDGYGNKIKIYNIIAWNGYIFYVGRYIDQTTGKELDDIEKNAECKFLKSGQHYLYYGKEWNIISEEKK